MHYVCLEKEQEKSDTVKKSDRNYVCVCVSMCVCVGGGGCGCVWV